MKKKEYKYCLTDLIQKAKEHNGKCLSRKYRGVLHKYLWQCSCGRKWKATWSSVQQGTWCKICSARHAGDLKKDSLSTVIQSAKKLGGNCLSAKYINSHSNLLFVCKSGHKFMARQSHVKAGHRCSTCAKEELSKRFRTPLAIIQKEITSKGGVWLSGQYKNDRSRLTIKCSNGHVFKKQYSKIKRGSWCPECHFFLSEEICRLYFESLSGYRFKKSRPTWLRYNEQLLELDGYNKNLNIAFEYQGEQHSSFQKRFHKTKLDYEKQIDRDLAKKRLCRANKVRLICISPLKYPLGSQELYNFFERLFKRYKIPYRQNKIPVRKIAQLYKINPLDKFNKDIARFGMLVDRSYKGMQTSYKVRCKTCSKIWNANLYRIRQGQGCPSCAGKNRDIAFFQKLAREHGGQCLSENYGSCKKKLLWRCSAGHQWFASADNIYRGTWCPDCSHKSTSSKLRAKMSVLKSFCTKNKIKLISEYSNARTKLVWKCLSNGHQFCSTFDNLHRRAKSHRIVCLVCSKNKS